MEGVVDVETIVDEAAMTGESLPVGHPPGEPVRSGTTNAGNAFELRASRPAAESAYAALVSLVQKAETERAPFVRLADRYALAFLPLTVALATAAWVVSGDPVRAVAVLVVATPCPLILAAPVALISGLSQLSQPARKDSARVVVAIDGRASGVIVWATGCGPTPRV